MLLSAATSHFGIWPDLRETPYPEAILTFRLAGDAPPEELAQLHEVAIRTSVNYFNITQQVPVNSQLVIE